MAEQDIHWQQRFSNYGRVFCQLQSAVSLMQQRDLSELEKQGVIQSFEYTYELAWSLLKDYLQWQGFEGVIGSRDAFRTAFKNGLVANGQVWMNMLVDRNKTSHTYNEATAEQILQNIQNQYFQEFKVLQDTFLELENRLENAQ